MHDELNRRSRVKYRDLAKTECRSATSSGAVAFAVNWLLAPPPRRRLRRKFKLRAESLLPRAHHDPRWRPTACAPRLMLYPDIWAAVAHELRGDVGGLRAGALLCRATRRTMQRELFHTVRVTDDLGDRWHALLAESAHLAAHVRRIVVHIRDGTCRRAFFQRCADAGLHGVRELRLAHIYWQLQDDPLLDIIAGAFPALRVLEALDSGFFSGRSLLYMLSAFTRLRILRLDRCALNDPHGAEDILTAPMQLKELWWSPLASPNGLTRLVTVPIPWAEVQTLGIRTDHAAMIWPELSRTQATLQHLAIPSMVHTEMLEQQLTAFGERAHLRSSALRAYGRRLPRKPLSRASEDACVTNLPVELSHRIVSEHDGCDSRLHPVTTPAACDYRHSHASLALDYRDLLVGYH
jgi:hypothetical protein